MTDRRAWFALPGRPVPYSRTTTATGPGGAHRRILPARYRDWRTKAAGVFNLTRRGRTFDEPVAVDVVVYPDRVLVRFTPAGDLTRNTLRGDLDNYAKAVLDAAQSGNILTNDRHVVALTARFAEDTEDLPA